MPHLICTAGNDQHVRVWDVRHFSKLNPLGAEKLSPPAPPEGEDVKPRIDTYPTSSVENERVQKYLQTPKGKGLQRAAYQHGKSCSAAYWDPWGRRIVTTSYDDKLRVWELNPQSFVIDQPLAGPFKPSTIIKHDCQTGRWLTILRAQWSLNTEYMPHFTVGNMKRTLDVFTATGERIAALWTDGWVPRCRRKLTHTVLLPCRLSRRHILTASITSLAATRLAGSSCGHLVLSRRRVGAEQADTYRQSRT